MSNEILSTPEQDPLACLIQDPQEMRQREQEVVELLKAANVIEELADGYAFSFPSEDAWGMKLMEFALFEKNCCPFFTFELVFEPQHGPLWLRLRGPEGVKEGMRESFAEVLTQPQ